MSAARRPTEAERAVLAVLSEEGGALTGEVGRRVSVRPDSHAAFRDGRQMRPHLRALAALGWVTMLDDQKPVCWLRTPAGTAALGEGP